MPEHELHIWLGRAAGRDHADFLHAILALYLGRPPDPGMTVRRCGVCGRAGHGKPMLAESAALGFSKSSADGLVGVALARRGMIGFDLERIAARPYAAIAREFAPEEQAALAAAPDARRAAAFHRLWTRKEALAKATGLGLALRLDSFAVSPPFARAAVTRAAPGYPAMTDWTLADLAPARGWAGAVAHDGPPVEIRTFAWPPTGMGEDGGIAC